MFRIEGRIGRRKAWIEWDRGLLTTDRPETTFAAHRAFEERSDEVVGIGPHQYTGPVQRIAPIAAYLILRDLFGEKVEESGDDLPDLEPEPGVVY